MLEVKNNLKYIVQMQPLDKQLVVRNLRIVVGALTADSNPRREVRISRRKCVT